MKAIDYSETFKSIWCFPESFSHPLSWILIPVRCCCMDLCCWCTMINVLYGFMLLMHYGQCRFFFCFILIFFFHLHFPYVMCKRRQCYTTFSCFVYYIWYLLLLFFIKYLLLLQSNIVLFIKYLICCCCVLSNSCCCFLSNAVFSLHPSYTAVIFYQMLAVVIIKCWLVYLILTDPVDNTALEYPWKIAVVFRDAVFLYNAVVILQKMLPSCCSWNHYYVVVASVVPTLMTFVKVVIVVVVNVVHYTA